MCEHHVGDVIGNRVVAVAVGDLDAAKLVRPAAPPAQHPRLGPLEVADNLPVDFDAGHVGDGSGGEKHGAGAGAVEPHDVVGDMVDRVADGGTAPDGSPAQSLLSLHPVSAWSDDREEILDV